MGLDDLVGHGHADAPMGRNGLRTEEGLENMRKIFFGDSGTRICNGKSNPVVDGAKREIQIFSLGRKGSHGVQGVDYNVMYRLFKMVWIYQCFWYGT